MDRTRATNILHELQADLEELEAQREGLTQKIDTLRGTISFYGERAGVETVTRTDQPDSPTRRVHRSGPGLKRILEKMLRERGRVSIDDAYGSLREMPVYERAKLPKRTTVGARFADLSREGKARGDGYGTYVWIGTDSNGSDPSAGRLEGLGDEVG